MDIKPKANVCKDATGTNTSIRMYGKLASCNDLQQYCNGTHSYVKRVCPETCDWECDEEDDNWRATLSGLQINIPRPMKAPRPGPRAQSDLTEPSTQSSTSGEVLSVAVSTAGTINVRDSGAGRAGSSDGTSEITVVVVVVIVVVVTILAILLGLGLSLYRRRIQADHAARIDKQAKFMESLLNHARIIFFGQYPQLDRSETSWRARAEHTIVIAAESISIERKNMASDRGASLHLGVLKDSALDALESGRPSTVVVRELRANGAADVNTAGNSEPFGTSLGVASDFVAEALLLLALAHPRVLEVVGFTQIGPNVAVVTEHCPNGDLKSFLRLCRPTLQRRKRELTAEDLLQAAGSIAEGMAFLESRHIVHRGLQASSVLVGFGLNELKLSRFDAARDIYTDRHYLSSAQRATADVNPATAANEETVRWTAPEAITDGIFSHASDAWALAITFFEVTLNLPRPFVYPQLNGVAKLNRKV